MKGVKYNLTFKKNIHSYDCYHNLKMGELICKIKKCFLQGYGIDIKVNNQICYNLMKRPHTANKLLRNFCRIEKNYTNTKVSP